MRSQPTSPTGPYVDSGRCCAKHRVPDSWRAHPFAAASGCSASGKHLDDAPSVTVVVLDVAARTKSSTSGHSILVAVLRPFYAVILAGEPFIMRQALIVFSQLLLLRAESSTSYKAFHVVAWPPRYGRIAERVLPLPLFSPVSCCVRVFKSSLYLATSIVWVACTLVPQSRCCSTHACFMVSQWRPWPSP